MLRISRVRKVFGQFGYCDVLDSLDIVMSSNLGHSACNDLRRRGRRRKHCDVLPNPESFLLSANGG